MTDSKEDRTRVGFVRSNQRASSDTTRCYTPSQLEDLLSHAQGTRERDRASSQSASCSSEVEDATIGSAGKAEPRTTFAEPIAAGPREGLAQTNRDNGNTAASSKPPPLPRATSPSSSAAPRSSSPQAMVTRIAPAQPLSIQSMTVPPLDVAHPANQRPIAQAAAASPKLSMSDAKTDSFFWLRRIDGSHVRLALALAVLGLALLWALLDAGSTPNLPSTAPAPAPQPLAPSEHQATTQQATPPAVDSVAQNHSRPIPEVAHMNSQVAAKADTNAAQRVQSPTPAITPRHAADLLFAGQRGEARSSYQALADQYPNEEVYRVIVNLLHDTRKKP